MQKDKILSFLFILPSLILVIIFVYIFIGWTGFISLTDWNDIFPSYNLVGFRNYLELFQNLRFQISMRNTLVFTTLFLLASLIIGFLLAIFLDQRIRGENLFRNIYLFPMAISFVVTGVVWRWILNPGTAGNPVGLNQLLDKIGLSFLKSGWYTDPKIGIKAVVIAAVWQMSGYVMAMYLAGIRSIPYELFEAAQVDGANLWQVYRYIVLPLLRPITLGAVIILGHISLKIFDLVVAMTGAGAGFSCDVPALFMYDTTFRGNHFAQGASIAIILLVMVGVLIVPYLRYSLRSEVKR
ncbi:MULTISPECIES: carbohydrate ABC transporter permease [Dictyoglomus]|uniref:Binding-protein-dependent transport systems inner membrane component n=1 Tax=Dictyoglomus turgidum (strain DSM 6724 / Z-1310) TaxID=515635 RepID=B8E0Q8_DICTD|nr:MULTISPECIES: sugar ABC transporter permease [Dictyoglomus]ACK43078.1 binding-protein-dependent transport systems inner membrane component [Dictyoglomus turgidum DSM 6724]PNV79255.1 MAG: sugar ABC transporter permease [Dictyoglomus turgidum]HBU31661.1 sugar ABC transporter permease [Dictyoglomus sp.]